MICARILYDSFNDRPIGHGGRQRHPFIDCLQNARARVRPSPLREHESINYGFIARERQWFMGLRHHYRSVNLTGVASAHSRTVRRADAPFFIGSVAVAHKNKRDVPPFVPPFGFMGSAPTRRPLRVSCHVSFMREMREMRGARWICNWCVVICICRSFITRSCSIFSSRFGRRLTRAFVRLDPHGIPEKCQHSGASFVRRPWRIDSYCRPAANA